MAKRSKNNDAKHLILIFTLIFGAVSFILAGIFKLFSFLFKVIFKSNGTGQYIEGDVLRDGLSKMCAMEYMDSDGEATTRKVLIQRIIGFRKSDGELFVKYIQGYCYLRQEDRTFKIDRINSITDLETGEFVEGWGKIINYFRCCCS